MTAPGMPPTPPLDSHGLPPGYPFRAEWEVAPRDAAKLLGGPEAARPLLLDCRRDDEFAFCRVEGATHVPMDQTVARADEIEDAAGGKDRPVIVYCHHGRRSLQVTATLRGLGFTDVRSIAGGIDLWSVAVDPGIKRY